VCVGAALDLGVADGGQPPADGSVVADAGADAAATDVSPASDGDSADAAPPDAGGDLGEDLGLPDAAADATPAADTTPASDGPQPDLSADGASPEDACLPAPEVCDGVDNDCDGEVDEDSADAGQPCALGVGACEREGVWLCVDGDLRCDATPGDPVPEQCNALDDDCDGAVDEELPRAGESCGSDEGQCQRGVSGCVHGSWVCVGGRGPTDELCDGLDNDCNGRPDDVDGGCFCTFGQQRPCGTAAGECRLGLQACSPVGRWGPCEGGTVATHERCDGLDNDCDGVVDNGNPGGGGSCGEALGECRAGRQVCEGGQLLCTGVVGPGEEVCDGLDNDCDGLTDEGNPDGGGVCGSNIGECVTGRLVCTRGTLECLGELPPRPEDCNQLDDDCDGVVDNADGGCQCAGEEQRACGTDEGACTSGLQRCNGGTWGPCEGEERPSQEVCDLEDNDCDGETDEEIPEAGRSCGEGRGECVAGVTRCEQGVWRCAGAVLPVPEVCDGLDNDCDGAVDDDPEDTGWVCGTLLGECAQGLLTCSAGALVCAGAREAEEEVCDGLDNDCDGDVDEEDPGGGQRCGTDVGACVAGLTTCDGGELRCDGAVSGVDEVCNGVDDDCDGQVDEVPGGCLCSAGEERACGSDQGECSLGLQRCADSGIWGACLGAAAARPERCDGLDNDCDGETDEQDPTLGQPCGEDRGACLAGQVACVDGELSCAGGRGPSEEQCNGLDDDCNGALDDAPSGEGQVCGSDVGECSPGALRCSDGAWVCAGSLPERDEVCDGLDNDCDGETDEGASGVGVTCGTNEGDCSSGQTVCEQGRIVCAGGQGPAAEVCDAHDNDCDGLVDNVPGGCECLAGDQRPCGSGQGECVRGVQDCLDGVWSACAGGRGPEDESCDGLDNDCDGQADEGGPEAGQPCGSHVGECSFGATVCVAGELLCEGGQGPAGERCDGLDNDCDGEVDEDWPALGAPCDGDDPDACPSGSWTCGADGFVLLCADDAPVLRCPGIDDDGDGLRNDQELWLGTDPFLADSDADGIDDGDEDFDHDGLGNRSELAAGTNPLPVLRLAGERSEPGVVIVAVHLRQPDAGLRPRLFELFVQYDPVALAWEEGSEERGEALAEANKGLVVQRIAEGRLRLVGLGMNADRIADGVLLTTRFSLAGPAGEPTALVFELEDSILAPMSANEARTFGVGHPAEPLLLWLLP